MSFLKTLTRDRVLGILLTVFVGLVGLQMIASKPVLMPRT